MEQVIAQVPKYVDELIDKCVSAKGKENNLVFEKEIMRKLWLQKSELLKEDSIEYDVQKKKKL